MFGERFLFANVIICAAAEVVPRNRRDDLAAEAVPRNHRDDRAAEAVPRNRHDDRAAEAVVRNRRDDRAAEAVARNHHDDRAAEAVPHSDDDVPILYARDVLCQFRGRECICLLYAPTCPFLAFEQIACPNFPQLFQQRL